MNEIVKAVIRLIDRVGQKLSSGKWVLTIVGGAVFAWAATHDKISGEAMASILTMIFISYFQKNKEKDDGTTDVSRNGNKPDSV